VHHTPKGRPIDLSKFEVREEFRPIRVYVKPDGSVDDKHTFLFLMQGRGATFTVAQISANMFRPFYEELKKIYEESR